MSNRLDPIISLFQSIDDKTEYLEKRSEVLENASIVFNPSPFVLHHFMSRKIIRSVDDLSISPSILAAWFHDCLSVLVHCHANNILLRTVQSEQFVVDQSGAVKIAALYRSSVLNSRNSGDFDPLREAIEAHRKKESQKKKEVSKKMKKKKSTEEKESRKKKEDSKKRDNDDDEFSGNLYEAPEILLGCPKYSKASDVWAVGCLLANLLLGKPLFCGKDRDSLLSSQYKVVGTPGEKQFIEGKRFPYFIKHSLRYKRDVEKAFDTHFNDITHLKGKTIEYSRAIDLISRMLHLDPKQRCTAAEALGHDYITGYIENCGSEAYRQKFAHDWVHLKSRMIQALDSDRRVNEADEINRKRTARMVAASKAKGDSDNDIDGLYDIDELLMTSTTKKGKTESDFLL
jgi:serine/threonine protein kinase